MAVLSGVGSLRESQWWRLPGWGLLSEGVVGSALRDVAPVLVAVLPFGLAIGAAVADAGVWWFAGWLGAPVVFAGSSHLSAVAVLGGGGSMVAAVLTGLVINARFAVYSAGLRPWFAGQPTWFRWLAPYFLVDQVFGLVVARASREGAARDGVSGDAAVVLEGRTFRVYYAVVTGAIGVLWMVAIGVGVALGPVIPDGWPVMFAGPAGLVGLLVGGLRVQVAGALVASGRAVTASVAAVGWTVVLLPVLGMVSVVAGAALGVVTVRAGEAVAGWSRVAWGAVSRRMTGGKVV